MPTGVPERRGRNVAGATELERQIERVATLRDRVRRALYLYVAQAGEVSREQAARAVGVQRALAAFHLDKLVETGLLASSFRRLSGRAGPGAGRPSKLYRRSARDVRVNLPPRNYELAADLLARAVDAADGEAQRRLHEAAHEFGQSLARQGRPVASSAPPDAFIRRAIALLEQHGFEPASADGAVYLRNCPFRDVAQVHPDVVCAMNLAIIRGVLAGLEAHTLDARLEHAPERCCVVLASARADPAG